MSYIYYNANPLGRHTEDCVKRALSKALGYSWDRVHIELSIYALMKAGIETENEIWGEYLERKGFNSPADLKNRAIANLSVHEKLNKSKQVYPYIDDTLCIKCGRCVTICDESEHSALSMADGHIVVDKEACVGCSLCSHICSKSAIQMKS